MNEMNVFRIEDNRTSPPTVKEYEVVDSAAREDISEIKADLLQKANIDGYYQDMSVGTADQLNSTQYVEDSVPYLFRTTGGSADVGDRADVRAIVGGSLVWNQLVDAVAKSGTVAGMQYEVTSDGKLVVSGTTTDVVNINVGKSISVVKGHKYLTLLGGFKSLSTGDLFMVNGWVSTMRIGSVYVCSASSTGILSIRLEVGRNLNIADYPQLFDLTAMFGSTIADYIYSLEQATAGAGVAWFKKLFPADYYPYDAGTLKSVEGVSSHDMVGFNQWDEEWELGYIDANGNNASSSTIIRSKNYIPVVGGNSYCPHITNTSSMWMSIAQYDANKGFVKQQSRLTNSVFQLKDSTKYIRFYCSSAYGTTYKNDICINLSDPAKNGTYKPYVKHSYALDPAVVLRGIPKLADGKLYYDGDRYLPDGTVERRYGIVDLGTLTYVKDTTLEGVDRFWAEFNIVRKPNDDNINDAPKALCPKFVSIDMVTANANYMIGAVGQYRNRLYFFTTPNTYADATAFKVAMSGVMLVYELATPTTETADPYQSLQVCDPNGTEEFVTTGIVPVGHETRYPENLRAKIEGLPWDFSTLIAPTETGTASRNYTVGSLLIMNNVLYKVTANIANGGTITPGTNVTATTLSEVISALQ